MVELYSKCLLQIVCPSVLDINECNQGVCVNAVNCTNTPGSFTCNCQAGWTGELCDQGNIDVFMRFEIH